MTDPIKKHPLRWFYVVITVVVVAVSYGIFYVGAHCTGWTRILIFAFATFVAQFVPRMLIRAIWGDS